MAKFSGSSATDSPTKAPWTIDKSVETSTFEGAPAYIRDARGELFLAAVTFLNEPSFYESADARIVRMRGLLKQIIQDDSEWLIKFVPFLRNVAQMRTSSIVLAVEYALAKGPKRRQVVDSAMSRADEPAEFVGYWFQAAGNKTFPAGVQRGVADAVRRLYNQYSVLKYDGSSRGIRMGDVLQLIHPEPAHEKQAILFKYLLERRYRGAEAPVPHDLEMISARGALQLIPEDRRRELVASPEWDELASSGGITWEYLSGWIPGGMDKDAWEAVIPQMGYMALLRNLRNFDEAGIRQSTKDGIAALISDPDQVAKSRQFPFRFWSAWNANQSMEWGKSLEKALDLSVQNIPEFEGSTLILVDVSGSMTGFGISARGSVRPCDIAGLFGAAVFKRNPDSRVVVFGDRPVEVTPQSKAGSVLRMMENFRQNHGAGHGTAIGRAVRETYQGENRVVIFTDMQSRDDYVKWIPSAGSIHYFNLQGYRPTADLSQPRVFEYGGFTDSTFRLMPLLEAGQSQSWDAVFNAKPEAVESS